MTWTDPSPALDPRLAPKLLPLPLLFQGLELLTMTALELTDFVVQELRENPLYEVHPPSDWHNELQDVHQAPLSREEELIPQLALCPSLKNREELARELVGVLDYRGFLGEGEENVKKRLGLSRKDMETILEEIRTTVSPPGLFARDLGHSFVLQLRREGVENSPGYHLVQNAWEVLKSQGSEEAMGYLGWSQEKMARALGELSQLDPAPGRNHTIAVVVPEVELFPLEDVPAVLLGDNLPQIIQMPLHWESPKTAFFQSQGAKLLRALERRHATKVAMAREVALGQKQYLGGESHAPAPLVLEQVARKTGHHLSTVQRAAGTTWARTPRGVIKLESLFSRPLKSRKDLSVAQLRWAIQRGLAQGTSDKKLGTDLGIPRRTIAWHRKKMEL